MNWFVELNYVGGVMAFSLFAERCGWAAPNPLKDKPFTTNSSNSTLRRNSSLLSFLSHSQRERNWRLDCSFGAASGQYLCFRNKTSSQSNFTTHFIRCLFDFDLRLFPQHRYTYCYNIFLIHPIQSTSSWMESIKNKSSFFCFWLMEWEREVDCWLPPSLKNFILQITE